jgi:hypothetical protein
VAKKKQPETAPCDGPDKIKFDYIKSNFFRVVHADGVWGGITPRQGIVMGFWSERPPIPEQMVFHVKPEGSLGEEIKEERKGREAIVREVEVNVMMELGSAKAFLAWLQAKVELLENQLQDSGRGKHHGQGS